MLFFVNLVLKWYKIQTEYNRLRSTVQLRMRAHAHTHAIVVYFTFRYYTKGAKVTKTVWNWSETKILNLSPQRIQRHWLRLLAAHTHDNEIPDPSFHHMLPQALTDPWFNCGSLRFETFGFCLSPLFWSVCTRIRWPSASSVWHNNRNGVKLEQNRYP